MESQVREEYYQLLRFASVGSDPAHLKDCTACALWLKDWLGRIGFKGELLLPDSGPDRAAPPVLFAERPGDTGAATVLFYGHYDVQGVEPLSAWESDPFEPVERNGRIYARGAQDDKGQAFAFLCGMRDFLAEAAASGRPVPNLKVCLEGQEESGSGALSALAGDLRRRLAADVLAVCDTSAGSGLRPVIVAGLRGVSHFTVRLSGPSRDLHSGEYGGVAPNPAQAIAELVASLHAPDGSIAVADFRDGIEPPDAEEKRLAAEYGRTEAEWAADIGCAAVGGQCGKTPVERNSFEPAIEVNGIHSGHAGPGAKTVIPAEAFAKISMRLVAGQSPRRAWDAVRRHLEDRCPRGMKLEFSEYSAGAGGFRLPLASPVFRLAAELLGEMDPRGAAFHWDGASIPVVSVLREVSGAAPLLVGWGQSGDRIHAPNESYSPEQFAKAREWARRLLGAL